MYVFHLLFSGMSPAPSPLTAAVSPNAATASPHTATVSPHTAALSPRAAAGRPVPRYMWEMYHLMLSTHDASCSAFYVLFDLRGGDEAEGDLLSAHLYVELSPRHSDAARHTYGKNNHLKNPHNKDEHLKNSHAKRDHFKNSGSNSDLRKDPHSKNNHFSDPRNRRGYPKNRSSNKEHVKINHNNMNRSEIYHSKEKHPQKYPGKNYHLKNPDNKEGRDERPRPTIHAHRKNCRMKYLRHARATEGWTGETTLTLLQVTITHLANSTAPATEVVRVGQDAVFDVTTEVRTWEVGGDYRVTVDVRPLDTGNHPLELHGGEDCDKLMWEVSLMVVREDLDASPSSRISFYPLEAMGKETEEYEEEEEELEKEATMEEEDEEREEEKEESRGRLRRSRLLRRQERGGKKWEGNNRCQRRSLYISFKDIGWDHIISPIGYEAGMCRGECKLPVPEGDSYTNHAFMSVLLHDRWGRGQGACCVPTKLDSLTVMMYNQAGDPVLKNFNKMAARKCECR
ncbi:decapentaplegic-like [Homarus americanus]|uniref:Decapentaplegic-like n=1 Tax=Homarus americanus TaxID=6706 RepID=A0A8J5N3J8_HOMAM|nr:decapentaplegic-like [Homarus americanus]